MKQVYLGLFIAAVAIFATVSADADAQDRVVSVGGDVTEIIYGLGKEDVLVATDSTSEYPAAAKETPKVGYLRQLSAEGVLSLEPDLILISGAAGPTTAVEQLRASGVTMIEMMPDYSVDGIIEKVETVAAALNADNAGEALKAKIRADEALMKERVSALGLSPRILFFAALRDGAPRAAGTETAADGLITLMGGTNVFGDFTGYKPLSLEAAVAADPDIILVMSHHADRVGGLEGVLSHPALFVTRAVQEGRVVLVDQVKVMQFGPRAPLSVAELAEAVAAGKTQVDDD